MSAATRPLRVVLLLTVLAVPADAWAQAKGAATGNAPARVSPAMVRGTNTGPGEVRVTWGSVPEASHYIVRRFAVDRSVWDVVANVPGTDTTWTDFKRNLAAPHRYSVAAVIGRKEGPPTTSPNVIPNLTVDNTTSGGGALADSGSKGGTSECNLLGGRYHCRGAIVQYNAPLPEGGIDAEVFCPPNTSLVTGGFSGMFEGSYLGSSQAMDDVSGREGWRLRAYPRAGAARGSIGVRFAATAVCERKGAR